MTFYQDNILLIVEGIRDGYVLQKLRVKDSS